MAIHVKKSSHSHRDPSAGGWDTSIVKAPDSHRSSKHGSGHHHRRRKKWPKVLAGVLIAVLVVVGVGVGAAFMYMKSIDDSMSLGDDHEAVLSTLTDTPASKPFYVLVTGTDMREFIDESDVDARDYTEEHGTRTDVILLMRVDAANSKLSILSIPRDTPRSYSDGSIDKLNETYSRGGASDLISAVEDITGVKISHYAEVSGSELESMIDGLDGITVNVPTAMSGTTTTGERVSIDAGLQRLSGAQALLLARLRKIYDGNEDMNRQRAARLVVGGIIDAIRSKPLAEIPSAVADAAACVRTDMKTSDLIELVRHMQGDLVVYSGTGPYAGGINQWAYPSHNYDTSPWLCYVNEAGWKRAIAALDAGEDVGKLSYDDDVVHYAGQPEDTWSQGPVQWSPDSEQQASGTQAAEQDADQSANQDADQEETED